MLFRGAADLRALVGDIAATGTTADRDDEIVDQLRALEEVKAAVAAAQARLTARLVESQQQAESAAQARLAAGSVVGFDAWRTDRAARRGRRSAAAQVALARRLSPTQGAAQVTLAEALTEQLPCTLAALESGAISEWRATIIARESSVLPPEQRAVLDHEIAGDVSTLVAWGDRELTARVRAVAYRLDSAAATERASRAARDRRVTSRPMPDLMCGVNALLPVAEGVAVVASLRQAADSARARGDARTRGQVMADTLVERVTGQATASAVPVEVQLVVSDATLLGSDDSAARVSGYGSVPADWARQLLERNSEPDAPAGPNPRWLRRLYVDPSTGSLTQLESRRRTFPPGMRRLVEVRDATCRTPWCDAPIRHVDHVVAHADGGPTSVANAQGLCERCNQTKQLTGWSATVVRAGRGQLHRTRVTTPTGHTYDATAPPLPRPAHRSRSLVEQVLAYALTA